jgi:outer membrane protein assembly factor BamB
MLGCGISCEPSPGTEPPPLGRVIWKVAGNGFGVVPSYDSASAYFASLDRHIVAIDKHSGKVRWKSPTGNGPGGLIAGFNTVVAANVVVVGDIDLYAFDRPTGALAWSFRASDDDETGTHAIATDGTIVYASSFYGRVYAIDGRTGVLRWMTQIPGPPGVAVATFDPTVGHGQIFVGVWYDTVPLSGGLAALDAASGRLLWVREFRPRRADLESFSNGGAVLFGDLVIASAADGQIHALDTASGVIRWTAPSAPGEDVNDFRAVALANDVVLASSLTGIATGIDAATGMERWSAKLSPSSLAYYVAADSNLAIFSTSELIALDPRTGAVRWRTGTGTQGGEFWGYPAVAPDRVYANGIHGFYALRK